MGQRLFNTGKIGAFLDTYAPGIEKRRGEEVSVVTLTLRVMPFDAKLASALDQGVGEDSNIRATVFSLNSGDPKPNFTRHDFTLGLPRQIVTPFASPDTETARLVFDQVKISGTYVRTQKDVNALAFVFKATFGPVGKDELEFIHAWHRTQKFLTFKEAEPLMELEDDGDDEDAHEEDGASAPARAPEFETDSDGRVIPMQAAATEAEPARQPRRHQPGAAPKDRRRRVH